LGVPFVQVVIKQYENLNGVWLSNKKLNYMPDLGLLPVALLPSGEGCGGMLLGVSTGESACVTFFLIDSQISMFSLI
jgi:hypothetical protein